MNILFLLIIHSAWSLDECTHSWTSCRTKLDCIRQLQNYLSECLTAPECDEKCSQLAKRILSHFGRNCIGKLGPDIAQIQARLNDGDCTVPVSNGHKRLAKRSASASRALDLEVIDGVSGGVQPIISPGIDSSLESGDMLRRSTRSPMSEQIRHWKNQLSGELQSLRSLDNFDCNRALYEVCLRHVSCRQLWNIFRTSCAVDASNLCVMTNREDCWQSFEGISWTGLGNCTCKDKNSDCHWIRLQTRYNKCVYEISHSGDFSTSISFLSREWSVHEIEEIPERYQISSDNYRPQSALQVNSVKNSERPTAALGPPRSEFDFSEVKKVNVERPASVSLLSKDSRPIQHQASPDRYPPVPNYVTKPLENIQSTIAEKENELQRVRPQLKPPDLTGPIRHSVNGHDLYMPLAARRNNTDNDRLNHRNRSQELLSSTESKYLYPSTSTSPPSGAVRYMPPLRSTTLPSDSLNSAHVPTRETYHSVSHPLVRADLRRTGAIYSTKMPAPNTRSHPTATFADDSKTSSGHLTHSKVQTSESGGQNPHRAQQITSTTSNAKAGDQRIRGTHAVTTSAYSLTQSVENSKMVTLLPDVAESTKRPSMTRGRDRLGTEITMRQGNGRGTTHQRALGILSENSAQRYSSKNGLTTQRPVTSIPQPPVDKDTRWDSGHNGVRSGSVNQSEPVRHGHVSELKGNMGIIHSETQFRQKDHSASTCVAAHHRCERFDACKWHLSEVQIRCTGQCNRQQCAAALQRFTRYVARPSVESLMFCHCGLADQECVEHQQVMYPRCLYSDREMGPLTCTEAVEKCRRDNQCQRYSSLFFEYCPVHNGQCTVSELDHCRQAIIAIRGTYLEYPCYCPQNDPVCRKYQSGMLPNNPCVERSMLEYSRLMSDNLPSITDERHTHSSGESSHHKTDVVDERGNQKVTTATEASDHTRWRAGSSTGHVVVHADRNHQRFKQPTVQNGNAEQMPKSVSRINPDEKHYYKSETGVSPSLTDDTHEFDDSDVEPLERRRQPTSIKSSVDNRKTGAHRMTSEERMKASAEHKGSDAKQKSVISSPRIVGTTFVSADDGLSKPDKSVQDMHPSTSEPFVLLTQKHRNLTLATNDTTSKSSTKMIKATTRISLRPSTSGPYVTHAPPPLGGCTTKDANGNTITHYKGSIVRRYHDWSGRCSSWCHCSADERLSCSKLPCMPEGECNAPLTTVEHGERLYIKDRGACTCQSGVFICDQPEDLPDLGPGVYLLVGYSLDEVAMLKETVPKGVLERSGFVSEDNFVAHDIGSRLQIALERLMPHEVQCRIMFLDEFKSEGNIIFQMEWFGINPRLNETAKRWHVGQAEKVCSPYVKKLAGAVSRNEAVRFQLVLSTVKQIRVLDLLDGLPAGAIRTSSHSLRLPLFLFVLGVQRLLT